MCNQYSFLRTFSRDSRGAIAIIFGFAFMILIGAIGGSVDYGRWNSARSATQDTLDAAVLAGGHILQLPNKTHAEAIVAAQHYFDTNKPADLDPVSVTFSVSPDGTEMRADSTSSAVKTPFFGVLGIPELKVNLTSKASLAMNNNSGSSVELAMMLDVTGSMAGQKIKDLRAAAQDLVDIIVWDDQSQYSSRVAIAPFSNYVNVGPSLYSSLTGLPTPTNANATCVKERSTSERYTDAAPGPGQYFDVYTDTGGVCPTGAELLPLTNNKTMIQEHIETLQANGSTAGHLGTGWAWYLVSPKWASVWPSNSIPQPYSMTTELSAAGQPKLYKIALLMTDGEYNTKYSGADSTTQAREICTNMKTAGVEVYSVGFGIAPGGTADVTMQHCATSTDHYYNAGDGEQLRMAFRDVALKILTLRISE